MTLPLDHRPAPSSFGIDGYTWFRGMSSVLSPSRIDIRRPSPDILSNRRAWEAGNDFVSVRRSQTLWRLAAGAEGSGTKDSGVFPPSPTAARAGAAPSSSSDSESSNDTLTNTDFLRRGSFAATEMLDRRVVAKSTLRCSFLCSANLTLALTILGSYVSRDRVFHPGRMWSGRFLGLLLHLAQRTRDLIFPPSPCPHAAQYRAPHQRHCKSVFGPVDVHHHLHMATQPTTRPNKKQTETNCRHNKRASTVRSVRGGIH